MISNPENIEGHWDIADNVFDFEVTLLSTPNIAAELALSISGVTAAVITFQKNSVVDKVVSHAWTSAEE